MTLLDELPLEVKQQLLNTINSGGIKIGDKVPLMSQKFIAYNITHPDAAQAPDFEDITITKEVIKKLRREIEFEEEYLCKFRNERKT